jgi:hypothetical protein
MKFMLVLTQGLPIVHLDCSNEVFRQMIAGLLAFFDLFCLLRLFCLIVTNNKSNHVSFLGFRLFDLQQVNKPDKAKSYWTFY